MIDVIIGVSCVLGGVYFIARRDRLVRDIGRSAKWGARDPDVAARRNERGARVLIPIVAASLIVAGAWTVVTAIGS
jgi:hypothetical protein